MCNILSLHWSVSWGRISKAEAPVRRETGEKGATHQDWQTIRWEVRVWPPTAKTVPLHPCCTVEKITLLLCIKTAHNDRFMVTATRDRVASPFTHEWACVASADKSQKKKNHSQEFRPLLAKTYGCQNEAKGRKYKLKWSYKRMDLSLLLFGSLPLIQPRFQLRRGLFEAQIIH